MQILGALNEPSVITARTQELSSKSIPPSKDPETPELEQQGPSRSRFGLPTPDTTPEHQRVAPGDRSRQAFVHLHGLQDAGQLTPSTSSEAHSTDDEDHHSLYLIHSEEPSGHPSLPPTAALSPRKTESHLSLSVLRSVYKSVVGFLNLAKKRTSRADDARVQGTIDLIKSIPTIRRTRVGNLTRKLTVKQYGQLLRVIEGYEDDNFRAFFQDKLRFDYTRQTQQFEIRMPTNVHEEVGDFIMDKLSIWRHSLELSIVPKVSNAAKTVKPSGSTDVQFSFTRGENDSKSPDRSVRHKQCERQCKNPTMLMEFAWSQEKENVREKAEAYIRRSHGEIRTVVAVDMRAMYLAERRNEKRLYQKYLAGEIDESYSYPDDDQNETGEALFLMWRARVGRNGQVNAVCVQNEKFRDEHGNPVKSVSLRLSLHDFLCKGIVNSQAGRFEAPLLDIASDELNDSLRETLRYYRQERNMVQKRKAEEEIERRLQEAAQKKSKKEQEPRTPPDVPDQRPGILGRIRKHGRLVSARFG